MNFSTVILHPHLYGYNLTLDLIIGAERAGLDLTAVSRISGTERQTFHEMAFISGEYIRNTQKEEFLRLLTDVLPHYLNDEQILVISDETYEETEPYLNIKTLSELDKITEDFVVLMPGISLREIEDKLSGHKVTYILSLAVDPLVKTLEDSETYINGDFLPKERFYKAFLKLDRILMSYGLFSRADVEDFYASIKKRLIDKEILEEVTEDLNYNRSIEAEDFLENSGTVSKWREENGIPEAWMKAENLSQMFREKKDQFVFLLSLILDTYRYLSVEEKLDRSEEKILFYLALKDYLSGREFWEEYDPEEYLSGYISYIENMEKLRNRSEDEDFLRLLKRRVRNPNVEDFYSSLFENRETLKSLIKAEDEESFKFILTSEILVPKSYLFSELLSRPKQLEKLSSLLFEYREELNNGPK